ncbi:hypothetical protein ACFVIM_31505 [Streptomyces sp. NPDC057638]|uniref:hypothetical protein n=1 Tax=Streptomyces sp. NPDC057638 TaxID=3346190 RepID=UPI0036803655
MTVNRRSSLTRTVVGTLAVGMMAAVGAVATAPTAQAQTAPSGQIAKLAPSVSKTFTLPKGVTTFTAGSGAVSTTLVRDAKQAQLNITCTLHVFNPYVWADKAHGSASVNCTSPMTQIRVIAGVYQDGALTTNTEYSYGSSWASSVAWRWYIPALYQSGAVSTLWFPTGHTPPTANLPFIRSAAIWL